MVRYLYHKVIWDQWYSRIAGDIFLSCAGNMGNSLTDPEPIGCETHECSCVFFIVYLSVVMDGSVLILYQLDICFLIPLKYIYICFLIEGRFLAFQKLKFRRKKNDV